MLRWFGTTTARTFSPLLYSAGLYQSTRSGRAPALPLQYVYPSLDKVNTSSYRHFHPEPFGAGAIQFDTQHTISRPGLKPQ